MIKLEKWRFQVEDEEQLIKFRGGGSGKGEALSGVSENVVLIS